MKLLKFYLRYFLFRSTRKVENIERVIRSHGFEIYSFRLASKESAVTKVIQDLGAVDYAMHHDAFVATNDISNSVFIKKGLCDTDRIILLFHEEAHIWYNDLNTKGFVDETTRQQEERANLFLYRIRFLKGLTAAIMAASLFLAVRVCGFML